MTDIRVTRYYRVIGDVVEGLEDFTLNIPFSSEQLEEIRLIVIEAEKEGCSVWEIMEGHQKLQDYIDSYLPDPYTSRHLHVWKFDLDPIMNEGKMMENTKFELNELETQRAKEFAKAHGHCHEGALGDKLVFSFIPTRMGDIIQVHCMACGVHQEITDMEKF